MAHSADRAGPGLLDALSLAAEATDELVLSTVRDTHVAVGARVRAALRLPGPRRGIVATVIYHGLGLGLRSAGAGLGAAGRAGVGPRLEDRPTGRFLSSAVNGLIGDRLRDQHPGLVIPMAVRVDGADVPVTTGHLAAAFPDATGRVVVFLHGLSEHEGHWDRHRDRHGTTYGEALAATGWTPVFLRLNTGLALRENGAALAALLQDLADAWPGGIDRIALVGHSMGGLVIRSACAVRTDTGRPWTERVSDVVTLGTPHLGAPLADQVGRGAVAMGRLPETAAFGRILDWRSAGVRDLVAGLAEEVPALPHARYRLVCATLTNSPGHPVARVLGDALVPVPSASGRGRLVDLFPGAEVLHVPRAGHLDLLNHPRVQEALAGWLA